MSCEIIQFSTAARVSAKRHVSDEAIVDAVDRVLAQRRERPLPEPLTETCKNQRLRNARKVAWSLARHTTDYFRGLLDWESTLSFAQGQGIPDALNYPEVDPGRRYTLVEKWRAVLVKQLLTPAPDVGAVTWKKAALKQGQHTHIGVKTERIEQAIAADVEWLNAHPTKTKLLKPRGEA